MNYDLFGYLNTGGLQMPSIKSEVSREAVFRVLSNLAYHCNEQDQNRVWVGSIKQATETKMGRSTILLARKALLQAGWLIDLSEREKFGAWVYRLEIPGFTEWLTGTNSQTTNSQTDIDKVGTSTGLGTGLGTGLNSQPQTELNKTNINTTQQSPEQTLIRLCKKIELTKIPSEVPFEKICNSLATQTNYLPVVKQALKSFGDRSANDRDCAIYVLSKIHKDNRDFKCTNETYKTLCEKYPQPQSNPSKLLDSQTFIGDLAKNYLDENNEPF